MFSLEGLHVAYAAILTWKIQIRANTVLASPSHLCHRDNNTIDNGIVKRMCLILRGRTTRFRTTNVTRIEEERVREN